MNECHKNSPNLVSSLRNRGPKPKKRILNQANTFLQTSNGNLEVFFFLLVDGCLFLFGLFFDCVFVKKYKVSELELQEQNVLVMNLLSEARLLKSLTSSFWVH